MNEVVGQQQWRTRVKGSVASFQMPWEDIIKDLQRNIGDAALNDIPRSAATVKYMLRVHLKVGVIDFSKKLKELSPTTIVKLSLFCSRTVFRQGRILRIRPNLVRLLRL